MFAVFSSGRYCLIQVSNDAMFTGVTSRPGVSAPARSAPADAVEKFVASTRSPARLRQDVGVVIGEAFRHPQRLDVVLVLVVERAELDRAQPLDVPVVEVLVRERAEPAHVGARACAS